MTLLFTSSVEKTKTKKAKNRNRADEVPRKNQKRNVSKGFPFLERDGFMSVGGFWQRCLM
jgi:hypothetical protein